MDHPSAQQGVSAPMIQRVIVTTTINKPSSALEEFAAMPGWDLLVVLDRKSPPFSLPGAEILTVGDQEALDRELSDAIGWNCIQRRNMGYLHAYRSGASLIATVDDDNIPLPGWGNDVRVGKPTACTMFEAEGSLAQTFDPLAVTSAPHLWHRGFPLTELRTRSYRQLPDPVVVTPDVEASLWLGDPDIDAVCRLEHAPYLETLEGPTPYTSTLLAPFNSQNTFLARSVLPEYFCFTGVGRFDDIWASYHLRAKGATVVYSAASVTQERNDHDLLVDLERETYGYVETPRLLRELRRDSDAIERFLPPQALAAFERYRHVMRHVEG